MQSFTEIEMFGNTKKQWLDKYLGLTEGIPSHDTFRRVLSMLDSAEAGGFLVNLMSDLVARATIESDTIAIDGKTLRRSYASEDKDDPLHTVQAFATETKLTLGQVSTDQKSNEITAIPRLLEILNIAQKLITIDAMGCQREIAKQIIDQGGDYVLAVKDNQPTLHQDIRAEFDKHLESDFADVQVSHHSETAKTRGRLETRDCYVRNVPENWEHIDRWKALSSIAMVISHRTTKGNEQHEVRYYIGSIGCDAKRYAKAIRNHWAIENSLHWVLDVTMNEDQCRTRTNNAAENLSLIRKLALNFLRHPELGKESLRGKQSKAALSDDFRDRCSP